MPGIPVYSWTSLFDDDEIYELYLRQLTYTNLAKLSPLFKYKSAPEHVCTAVVDQIKIMTSLATNSWSQTG